MLRIWIFEFYVMLIISESCFDPYNYFNSSDLLSSAVLFLAYKLISKKNVLIGMD